MRKEKYINPFTNFGFKRLFGTEYNKDLLIDFVNQVLGHREQIKELTYLHTEQQGRTETNRKAVYDLYCENQQGDKFIIEVQNASHLYCKDRSLYYATFPLQEQAQKGGQWDYQLKAVYTICILNFSFPDTSGQERYLREVQLLDKYTHEVFFEKLTFIYLEMPRFRKSEQQLLTHFDKWLYVLKHLHKLQDIPKKLREKIVKKLFNQAEIAKLNPEEMRTYDESLKIYWDNYSLIETAKHEGREQGREQGREEGLQQGKRKRDIEIAREMKKEGDSIEKISRITGLSKEQIANL
ncbi:MAG: Rpn family recombination-promoting nuclease/putative transposase [Cytophagales bacterium]|nr:Rpn family recombination-promoting nuclease/putative transposase [Cytophagales bacterium]